MSTIFEVQLEASKVLSRACVEAEAGKIRVHKGFVPDLMRVCLWQQAQIERLQQVVATLVPGTAMYLTEFPNCGVEPEEPVETLPVERRINPTRNLVEGQSSPAGDAEWNESDRQGK